MFWLFAFGALHGGLLALTIGLSEDMPPPEEEEEG